MRYICAQPTKIYYSWQVDAMILSFKNAGIEEQQIDIVCADYPQEIDYFLELRDKYPKVNFYFYPDLRVKRNYISSIRPHILMQHFRKYPYLYTGTFMYHDCDIALTRPLDISQYLCGCNQTCYLSDTISYIGYEYILSKGEDVLDLMCKIVDIDKELVKENQDNSGGAQYILKNIDYTFWAKVEEDSENLYTEILRLNKKKKELDKDYHALQIWCADMWAVLWNLWKLGRKTEVIPELDFTWGVENINGWYKRAIYHNAGVVDSKNKKFYKALYVRRKPPKDLDINPQLACFEYYQLVKQIL